MLRLQGQLSDSCEQAAFDRCGWQMGKSRKSVASLELDTSFWEKSKCGMSQMSNLQEPGIPPAPGSLAYENQSVKLT